MKEKVMTKCGEFVEEVECFGKWWEGDEEEEKKRGEEYGGKEELGSTARETT